MTNLEYIKQLNKEQMAKFLNFAPSCNEICKDAGGGCAFTCKYNQGYDIFLDWLDKEF